jgi:hypothetical protein
MELIAMNHPNQEDYNEGLRFYYELEKRLGLIKDDKELLKEFEERQKD